MTQTIDTATIDSYDSRIRAAYRRVIAQQGRRIGDYVSLTDLRPEVGGYRPYVDAALRRMARGDYQGPGEVMVIPEANQKTLSQLDRAEAVVACNQALHCISIR